MGDRTGILCRSGPSLAGKGSVAVLLHDEDDGAVMPAETARARRRFGVLCVLSFCVLAVVVIATV